MEEVVDEHLGAPVSGVEILRQVGIIASAKIKNQLKSNLNCSIGHGKEGYLTRGGGQGMEAHRRDPRRRACCSPLLKERETRVFD